MLPDRYGKTSPLQVVDSGLLITERIHGIGHGRFDGLIGDCDQPNNKNNEGSRQKEEQINICPVGEIPVLPQGSVVT